LLPLITSGRENNHLNQMATLEQNQIIWRGRKHCEDGNSAIAPRLRGGSPAEMGWRINRSSFTLKAVTFWKARQTGAINRETQLDRGLSSAPGVSLPATAFGADGGNEELPSCLLLLPHPARAAQGAFTLFPQACNWGMIRELNLGAEALEKSVSRGGSLGSSGARD